MKFTPSLWRKEVWYKTWPSPAVSNLPSFPFKGTNVRTTCTCMWIGKSFCYGHSEAFFFFFFLNVKGKFYFRTFKHVMVKLASKWVFLCTHQCLVSMHRTLKMVDWRTYAHWENDQKDPGELDTVDITLSVSRMFPEQTKKREATETCYSKRHWNSTQFR